VSATEKRFLRNLRVKVAKAEMLDAVADGRLKQRVPLRIAVHELDRALGERRKLRRSMAGVALQASIDKMQTALIEGEHREVVKL
jgi:hypothetical protein